MNDVMTELQLTWSTAEDALAIFSGESAEIGVAPEPTSQLPAGTYRVIDGGLVRLVAGAPIDL